MKTLSCYVAVLAILFFQSCATDDVKPTSTGPADETNLYVVKDAAFGEYLKYLKIPGVYSQTSTKAEGASVSYVIDTVEAKQFTGEINLSKTAKTIEKLTDAQLTTAAVKITDLDGIQYFPGTTILNVISNELTQLDVSNLPNLTELTLNFNAISELDLARNTKLQKLTYKRSTSAIPDDGLSLSAIDLSRNVALTTLVLTYHQLETIDLSYNTNLTTLDLSANTGTPFEIPEDIYNHLSGGSNGVQAGQGGGDTPEDDNLLAVNTAFGEYLAYRLKTDFPGVVEKKENQYFINKQEAAKVTGDLELSKNSSIPKELEEAGLVTAATKLTDINGIQYLTGISSLKLTSNELTALDVTALVNLTELNLNNNWIGTLDLTRNTKLEVLSYNASGSSKAPANSKLTTIDLSHNKALTSLSMTKHQLETIHLDENTALKKIDLSGNPGADFTIPAAIYNQAADPKKDMKGVKPAKS